MVAVMLLARRIPNAKERLLDVAAVVLVMAICSLLLRAGYLDFNCDDAEIEYVPATREIARARCLVWRRVRR